MKKLILLGLAAAIASAAMASTTFHGQTGLIMIPTAVVAPVDTLNFAVDYWDAGVNGRYPIRATYGVAENWEVGASYMMNEKTVSVSGKWVTPLTGIDSKLGVGAIVHMMKGAKSGIDVYGALTKEIDMGKDVTFNGHAYLGCNLTGGTTFLNPAIGADATFANAGDLNVAAEYQFRGSTFGFKGSYPLGNGWGIQAGFLDSDFFAGANYTFGTAE